MVKNKKDDLDLDALLSADPITPNIKDDDIKDKIKILSEDKDELKLSEEKIKEHREETLKKIEDYVNKMKENIDNDSLADYMLQNRIVLLEQSKFMLSEYMVTVLNNLSTTSRAYEVLAKLFETVAGINNTLVNISEDKAKIKAEEHDKKLIENTTNVIGDIIQQNLTAVKEQNKFREKSKDIKVVNGGSEN